MAAADREPTHRWRRLPEPVDRDALVTSEDVTEPAEPDTNEFWRETSWLLRTAGLG